VTRFRTTPEIVSDLAARHGVSRKFVYQQTHKAVAALDGAFLSATPDHEVLFELAVTKAWLRQVIVGLTLICRSYRGVVGIRNAPRGRSAASWIRGGSGGRRRSGMLRPIELRAPRTGCSLQGGSHGRPLAATRTKQSPSPPSHTTLRRSPSKTERL
jgi:hypothetical protein